MQGAATTLNEDMASRLARIALRHVTREWPSKLDHVMTGPDDVRAPRELHPIFYGSFDWHSSVHSHWLLARILRRLPRHPEAAEISRLFDAQFTPEKVAGERAYLARPSARAFERPYGWAWLLMLAGELVRHDTAMGRRWAESLRPLASAFCSRFRDHLPLAAYPVRAGVHSNTAFALVLTLDYARAAGDDALAALCEEKARAWYGDDEDCQAWEPSGEDFLSPSLVEAACMSAVLARGEFHVWFARFLPRIAEGEPATLFRPVSASERSDGKIVHLDGLNLSRAWCWRLIAECLDGGSLQKRAAAAIDSHLASALVHLSGDYAGEHWLGSFALLALDPHP